MWAKAPLFRVAFPGGVFLRLLERLRKEEKKNFIDIGQPYYSIGRL